MHGQQQEDRGFQLHILEESSDLLRKYFRMIPSIVDKDIVLYICELWLCFLPRMSLAKDNQNEKSHVVLCLDCRRTLSKSQHDVDEQNNVERLTVGLIFHFNEHLCHYMQVLNMLYRGGRK